MCVDFMNDFTNFHNCTLCTPLVTDLFALRRQPFSVYILCHVQISIAIDTVLANFLTSTRCTVLFDCV